MKLKDTILEWHDAKDFVPLDLDKPRAKLIVYDQNGEGDLKFTTADYINGKWVLLLKIETNGTWTKIYYEYRDVLYWTELPENLYQL